MRASSLLVACAVIASGCTGLPDSQGDDPLRDSAPDAASVFSGHTLVGKGGDAESSLWVSPDGQTILACSHGGFTRPSPLWASTDGGATFSYIDPQPNPVVSGDCDLTVTEDGRWFIVYDTIASATVASSADQGRTWRFHYFAAPPFGGVDRPWLLSAGNTVFLFYASVMAAEPFVATMTRSSDGGLTWSPPVVVERIRSAEESNCFMGHPIVKDAGRTFQVPINCWPGLTGEGNTFPNTIHFVTSRDGGATWSRAKASGPHTSGYLVPSATYAGNGTTWLAYAVGGEKVDVFATHSTDGGASWSEPLLVASDRELGLAWVWIDGRPDGTATVAWMDVTPPANETGGEPYWRVHAARVGTDGLRFAGPVGDPARGSALFEYLMVRHDSAGRAYLLYVAPGDGCANPPPGPNQDRNQQCVHLLAEGASR